MSKRVSLFAGIPEEELAEVLRGLERLRFPAGSRVIAEGDKDPALLIVVAGAAEVFVSDRHGVEHRVGRAEPGTSLGEMSLLTGQPAAASVRATTDLDVLVLKDSEFERLATRFPVVYRNVSAILSDRLARTDKLAADAAPGGLAVLVDDGAPPLLGYALASSLAWHMRAPTALLVPEDLADDDLRALAASAGERGLARADVVLGPSTSARDEGSLAFCVEDLHARYEYVLLQSPADAPELRSARRVSLLGTGGPARDGALSLRGWASPRRRLGPDAAGVVAIPRLAAADDEQLRAGLLPATTDAGRAVGWVARDLADLKVGLALGAGSIRGYAHIGALRVLERAGVGVDYLAGTSVGSAVAGLYALGKSPDEIADTLDAVGAVMLRPTIPVTSILSSRGVRSLVRSIGGGRHIQDLPIPLALVAADVITGREVLLRQGELALAVLASISIPGVYPPLRIGPYALVDGGVLNPVPTSVVAEMGAGRVIAVRLATPGVGADLDVAAVETRGPLPSIVPVLLRSFELMQERILPETRVPTVFITPTYAGMPGTKLRHFREGRRFIEQGEAAAEEALPRISAALPWLNS